MDSYHEPIRDIAHLGHVELLTPKPDESLRFFLRIFSVWKKRGVPDSRCISADGDNTKGIV